MCGFQDLVDTQVYTQGWANISGVGIYFRGGLIYTQEWVYISGVSLYSRVGLYSGWASISGVLKGGLVFRVGLYFRSGFYN